MFHKCETIESLCYLRTVLYFNFLSICIHVSNGEEKFSATYFYVWCGIYIECGRYVSLWAPSTTVSNFFSFDVHYTLLHYRLLFVSLDILCCRKVVSSIHYSFWGIYDKLMYGTYASSRYLVTWSNSLKNLSRNQDQWKKLCLCRCSQGDLFLWHFSLSLALYITRCVSSDSNQPTQTVLSCTSSVEVWR